MASVNVNGVKMSPSESFDFLGKVAESLKGVEK